MSPKPKILICPLNWGIGHATRCVPIIRELIRQGAEVIIGASGYPKSFLSGEFPDLQIIDFPGHHITYAKKGSGLRFQLALQVPALLRWIKKENRILHELIKEYNINGVISDNRFGLYSQKVPSVYITHQVFLKTNLAMNFIDREIGAYNLRFINKYTKLWVPDLPGRHNLSGELSHRSPLPTHGRFLGILSRFQENIIQKTDPGEFKRPWDVCVILSGPEPQRSILEKIVMDEIKDSKLAVLVAGGRPGIDGGRQQIGNSYLYPHISSADLKDAIKSSDLVISRSGYSTVMDLVVAGKDAVLVPTPGQPEQLYLANYLQEQGWFSSISQEEFSINKALSIAKEFPGKKIQAHPQMLSDAVAEFLGFL